MGYEIFSKRENSKRLLLFYSKKTSMQDKGLSQRPMRQLLLLLQRFLQGPRPVSFPLRECCVLLGLSLWLLMLIWISSPVWAIVQHPSQSQILEAVEKGQEGARSRNPPNTLYWRFGESEADFLPHGFLMTKLSGIAVMSGHFALRGELPTTQEIQRVVEEEALQIVVMIFGDSPTFAMDSYLLLKQGNRLIKPDRIRFDARASSISERHGTPVFRAKIVASFVYGTFDLEAPTTIKVFPGAGGEFTFDLNFSAIP
jgi:hypothetical protein